MRVRILMDIDINEVWTTTLGISAKDVPNRLRGRMTDAIRRQGKVVRYETQILTTESTEKLCQN